MAFFSLHLRALALEYDRKRRAGEHLKKVAELTSNARWRLHLQENSAAYLTTAEVFRRVYILSMFDPDSGIGGIDHFVLVFRRNLEVSCCGCSSPNTDSLDDQVKSLIGYNLISYPKISMLALTCFTDTNHYLDAFRATYSLPYDPEPLLNDIAFMHCEEPLIAPRLWHSLSDEQKLAVRSALRHPDVRTETTAPRIIRLDYAAEANPAWPVIMVGTTAPNVC